MASTQRKFRIESVNVHSLQSADAPVMGEEAIAGLDTVSSSLAATRHQEIMDAIARIGSVSAEVVSETVSAPVETMSPELLDKYREEIREAAKLKSELDLMQQAIARTKQEIVALRYEGASTNRIRTVTDELDEVVAGTEAATETILSAAETIDNNATSLAIHLDSTEVSQAVDIQEQVVCIYEACNFQDITGQRITKVVNALRYIEERVDAMLAIWGDGALAEVDASTLQQEKEDVHEGTAMANGPSMPHCDESSSQAEIDALFD